jgi:5-methylcytosine-specific restriction enzyme subunit McrC
MVEIAYRLDLAELDGLIDCQSLAEFYERLAYALARRVLDRGRKGFYRAYLPRQEPLPYLRGRLDTRQAMTLPGQVNLTCHYQEHTADVAENQILAWTLWSITRSGLCTERTLPLVRRAYRALQGRVSLESHLPQSCIGRLYTRLNQDYQPLHALCRFFLEQTGPTHHWGDHKMFPFLINMASLYEQFVAEWVANHLPPTLHLKPQEKVHLGEGGLLNFEIDLVLYDTGTGQARCVLDTKYKRTASPAQDDIFQIIAYAEAKGCDQAILIYPTPLAHPLDEQIGGIRVRTLTFALDGDLNQAGQIFLEKLVKLAK